MKTNFIPILIRNVADENNIAITDDVCKLVAGNIENEIVEKLFKAIGTSREEFIKDKEVFKPDTIDFMELKWSNNGIPYKNNEKVFTGYTGPFPMPNGHEFDGLKKALEQDAKLWVDKTIKVEELHNLVKEHPYRTNNDNKYLVSYLKLLDKFFKEFRKIFQDLTNKQYIGLDRMTHDLNATLWRCKEYKTVTPIQLQYLEAGLTVYHHYMEYKECPCFYELSKETIYCHQWSKKYQKYFLKLSDKEKYLKMQKDLRKKWGKQTGDIEEVINDSCNELQYIYDNYDEIFNDDTEIS